MLVRTVLLAVLKAAPENLRENLLRAVGSGIKDQLENLDFGFVAWLVNVKPHVFCLINLQVFNLLMLVGQPQLSWFTRPSVAACCWS